MNTKTTSADKKNLLHLYQPQQQDATYTRMY